MKKIPKWYRVKYVRHCLATEDKVALECLMLLHEWYVSTGHCLRRCDGEFLSSLAEQYTDDGTLSAKQFEALRKVMPRYGAQIVRTHAKEEKLLKRMERDGWQEPGRLEEARRERRS